MRSLCLALLLSLLAWGADIYQIETQRLASLMHWKPGDVVADIGAGGGEMSIDAAEQVGPTGHVYTTELDDKKLQQLKKQIADRHLKNVTAVKAGPVETNLLADCCDDIFMRRVYHHFTKPASTDSSIFQALKPGGYLAVIDFEPKPGLPPVAGVPSNRGGHGIPEQVLINELKTAGFQIVTTDEKWPDSDYLVLAQKPVSAQ